METSEICNRKRHVDSQEKTCQKNEVETNNRISANTKGIIQTIAPAGTEKELGIKYVDDVLKPLTPRWKNWYIRGILAVVMISSFIVIVSMGPIALMLLTIAIQVMCFYEIISIGYAVYRTHDLPWFRAMGWYFLLTVHYFLFGEYVMEFAQFPGQRPGGSHSLARVHKTLVSYHRFISFTAFLAGFIWFVLGLKKGYYLRQFSMLAYTVVALLSLALPAYLLIQNMFTGVIWLLVPCSLVIANDIFAYVFGFFFGRTPLIQVSPKKTWEGFIGGMVGTLAFGAAFSALLVRWFPWVTCPVQRLEVEGGGRCALDATFTPREYRLPGVGRVHAVPFQLHTLCMALFSSVIAPFSGFFASGLKRAFRIKDFGDLLPGHGGVMDRFDCQYIMAIFVNVYVTTFIRNVSPERMVQRIAMLAPEDQLRVFELLLDHIRGRGLLADSTEGGS